MLLWRGCPVNDRDWDESVQGGPNSTSGEANFVTIESAQLDYKAIATKAYASDDEVNSDKQAKRRKGGFWQEISTIDSNEGEEG